MRWRNDEKLALKVPEIDLILGGFLNQLFTISSHLLNKNNPRNILFKATIMSMKQKR